MPSYIRQPIVVVLGHIDHGKTTLLDRIRGTSVASRESGAITQHIGATEIPTRVIEEMCSGLLRSVKLKIPGLLFIDTPGHQAFISLRKRGGVLADLAILVIDLNEGFRPQTIESINILRQYRTPFLIAANKIDLIPHWKKVPGLFPQRLAAQDDLAQKTFQEKFYELLGDLSKKNFKANLYGDIKDFRKELAIVPCSSKTGEGVPELLMVLTGLSQKYLEGHLETPVKAPGMGTILEVKEEKGWGVTLDAIIYSGTIREGERIAVGTREEPVVTTIRALLRPKFMAKSGKPEFARIAEAVAAAGVKILAPGIEEALPGSSFEVVHGDPEKLLEKIRNESRIEIKKEDEGVIVKADTLGSLEAIAHQFSTQKIPIRDADVGDVSKKDVVNASTNSGYLNQVILAFRVSILPDAKEESKNYRVTIITDDVIYGLLEKYDRWKEQKKFEMKEAEKKRVTYPALLRVFPGCIFRISKPAIVGVRVISGSIKPGTRIMNEEGESIGKIKSIQSEGKSFSEAKQGDELAIAIDGAVVGKNLQEESNLYSDISEGDARKLQKFNLTYDEMEVLQKIIEIKRKKNFFWAR